MHAPAKADYPVVDPNDLLKYDAILFGIPTRYGNFPAQWKAFWDKTGGIWAKGGYYGKYVGTFVSTGSLGGGQETTPLTAMSTFVHHGMVYVSLGYAPAFSLFTNVNEVRGGTAWGAGTFAVCLFFFPAWDVVRWACSAILDFLLTWVMTGCGRFPTAIVH